MTSYHIPLTLILLALLPAFIHANVRDNFGDVNANVTTDVYNHLWLDGRDTTIDFRALLPSVGGILIDNHGINKIRESLLGHQTTIACQLSNSLDLGDYHLPTVRTLSAVPQKRILQEFAQKYTALAKSFGIDYMVLPNTALWSSSQQLVYEAFRAQDSTFYIASNNVVSQVTIAKKTVKNLLDQDKVLLLDISQVDKMQKTLRKLRKEKWQLSNYLNKSFEEKPPVFSTQLITSIYEKSIVHLSGSKSILPLNIKEIGFLSQAPNGPLATELKKYFKVRDISENMPLPNQPIIVDGRIASKIYIPFIDQYKKDHHIIALISQGSEFIVPADEYIYVEENVPLHDIIIPQMIFGAVGIEGLAPGADVGLSAFVNTPVESIGKLRYTPPEWQGLSSEKLRDIEKIAESMINNRAAPGCQVSVIKGGSIIYNHSFGHLTYDSLIAVNNRTIYDIASVTKVLGTLLAVMHLYEADKFQLEDSIATHLPQYKSTNKGHITIKQLLSHQSGLRAYEPLWKRTLKGDFLEPFSYLGQQEEEDDLRSYGAPIHPVMMDSIRNWLIRSPLVHKDDEYHYSDIGFMVLKQLVEHLSGKSIEQYLFEEFYHPMGLHYTVYNPLEKGFEIFEIAPTEFDRYYRNELVWGRVHDRNAAIFGGVGGHAGLFSSAHELAILMHMLVREGNYAGKQYLKPETVSIFNQQHYEGNRRALGWDKYDEEVGNAAQYVSPRSFGHTGFTGTMVWADPEHDLIFTFVSNRIYPDSRNKKLLHQNIRGRIQEVVYESFLKY